MSFRDTFVTCQECGRQFVFTVEKQRQMASRGQAVVPPDRCEGCTPQPQYGSKRHGRLKWFSLEKGYGFIAGDDGKEVFVHRNGIPLTAEGTFPVLEEGQEVLYEVQDSPKGPQAVQVVPYVA